MMSQSDAQKALSTCDLSDKENFKSYVQCDLENIFATDANKSHEVVKKENK